jgi:hypothetical protein
VASLGLDPRAQTALDEYLARLDAVLPGAWVYLTGSAALGDWRPGRSDLDILTVTPRPLDEAGLDASAKLHAGLPGRPYRDAVYLHRGDLGPQPQPDGPGSPHVIDGVFSRSGYEPDPVLWATLDRQGLTVRGPDAASLGAAPDLQRLREWNAGNLASYWRPWAAGARTRLDKMTLDAAVPAEVVVWGALGPGRLHCTIATGRIISKTAAADYTAEHFPGYDSLLARAKAWRLGDDTITFSAADGRACCELVSMVASASGSPAAPA